jgi:hypothetical protein
MRKLLEFISIAAVANILWQTYLTLYGPDPITFSSGWDPTSTLLIIPFIAIALYLLVNGFSSFWPAFRRKLVNTPTAQPLPVSRRPGLSVWIKTEILVALAIDQYAGIQFARIGSSGIREALLLIYSDGAILGFVVSVTLIAYWKKPRKLSSALSTEQPADTNADLAQELLAGEPEKS